MAELLYSICMLFAALWVYPLCYSASINPSSLNTVISESSSIFDGFSRFDSSNVTPELSVISSASSREGTSVTCKCMIFHMVASNVRTCFYHSASY